MWSRRQILFAPDGARLDAIDLNILRRLHEDARVQNKDLAVLVGLSPSACLQRVRRIEDAGAIIRHSILTDEAIFSSWSLLWVKIKLRRNVQPVRQAFEIAVNGAAEVVEAHELAGGFDYLLKVALPVVSAWAALQAQLDPDGELIQLAEIIIGVRTTKLSSPHPLLVGK